MTTISAEQRASRIQTWFVSASVLFFWISLYMYVPVLPVYALEKGATLQITGLLISSYGLLQLLLRFPLGVFSDRIGSRRLLSAGGLALSAVGSLGLWLTNNPMILILFRGVTGAAAAFWVLLAVLFTDLFPADKMVRATGIATALSVLGQLLGSSSGGIMAERLGTPPVFWTSAILAVMAILTLLKVKEKPHPHVSSGGLDIRSVITNRTILTVSLAAAAGQYVAYATTYGFLPVYLSQLGANKEQLGWVTTLTQFGYMMTALFVGLIGVRRAERKMFSAGFSLICITTLSLLWLHSLPLIFISRLIQGIGQGLTYPVLMGMAIQDMPAEKRASAMGLFQAIYALGMFAGPAASGFLAAQFGINSVFLSTGLMALMIIPVALWGTHRHLAIRAPFDGLGEPVEEASSAGIE